MGTKKSKPNSKGVCDEPIWVKAKGKGKWKLKLKKKQLKKGKYVAYSRVTNKGGATEHSFTKKDKNRREFKVK